MNIKNKKNFTVDISLIAVFTAVICICSWISLPIGGIPVSLQTLAVFVGAALLGAKRSVVSVFVYISLGLAGLPVFSGFRSGVSVIFGPTGGYLIGFVFAAGIIGIMTKLAGDRKWSVAAAMTTGQGICYLFGTLWYQSIYLESAVSLREAIAFCIMPFVIPDIIKIIMSVILSQSVIRILKKQNIDTFAK